MIRLNINKLLATFWAAVFWAYLSGVYVWLILKFLFYDRWWWLFFLNSLSLYLFVLVPVVLIYAWFLKNKIIAFLSALLFLVAILFFGGLFVHEQAIISKYNISVMTYNIFGFNIDDNDKIITSVRHSGADVVALQELNNITAELVKKELIREYPFQILNPASGVHGMGVISRMPIKEIPDQLLGNWLGKPQIIELELNDRLVKVVNIHSTSVVLDSFLSIKHGVEAREQQARSLVDYVKKYKGPIIVAGDFNTTDQSYAYKILTSALIDSWRDKGFGFGHTFPGGVNRYKIHGILIPQWLFRVDYIFHTTHFNTQEIYIGEWNDISDHRPVIAKLSFN